MHATRIDLPEQARTALIGLLNERLADGVVLATHLKQAHWNVKGPSFIALHELFDAVTEEVRAVVDDLAERIAQLGGVAVGSAKTVAAVSQLAEYPADIVTGPAHVKHVADQLAMFANGLRAAIDVADDHDDTVTEDILTGAAGAMDKQLWFVEAHLQAER